MQDACVINCIQLNNKQVFLHAYKLDGPFGSENNILSQILLFKNLNFTDFLLCGNLT